MRKYLLLLLLLIPINIYAIDIDINNYNKKDLNQILEDVKVDNPNINENNNGKTIYLIYGSDCNYSKAFMKFYVEKVLPEYHDDVHLVGFETWHDSNNASLFKTITSYKKSNYDGSPYIIVGSRIFEGYTSSYDSQIINAIKNHDNKDIFEEMKNYKKNDFSSIVKLSIICLLFIILFIVALRFINKKNNY